MNIVYLGSSEFGIECLNAITRSQHRLRLIVTSTPRGAGRGRKPRPTPVAHWAETNSVPAIETENVNQADTIRKIAGYEPDLLIVIAFGQKISNDLINLPPKGAINVHASLLPKYRGAAPVNWAIINGETETGVTIIALAEKMDAGDILSREKTHIAPDETAGRLHNRLAGLAAPLLIQTLEHIAGGTAVYTEQDHCLATQAPKLKKSDGFLDFTEPAQLLERKIRGLWPWPGAAALYKPQHPAKAEQLTIAAAKTVHLPGAARPAPGTFDDALNLICGRNGLKITQVKPAGSRLMDFRAFVNGRATRPGDRLVKISS